MDTNDYLPRVLEDEYQPESTVSSDCSKWTAVHDALENPTSKSRVGLMFTMAWVLGLVFGVVWVWRNGKTVFGQWKENLHRRANRRLHGIPDDDDRPFNVAYAAAALSRKQRKGKRENPQTLLRETPKSGNPGESTRLRQRPLHTEFASSSSNQHVSPVIVQARDDEFVPRPSAQPAGQPPEFGLHDRSGSYQGRGIDQTGARPRPQGLHANSLGANTYGRNQSDRNEGDRPLPERRKHNDMNDDDDDTEMRMSKKSRVDEEESMEGDNDTPSVPGGLRLSSLQVPKRGAKRHVNIADEGDWEMSQDKRARKGSLAVPESDALEVDEAAMDAEPSGEVHSTIRGTKREREELDSVAGDDVAERSQPSRKRRDDGKGRVAEIASRGRKRDRSTEKPASGEEESDERYTQAMRRKRGRQHTEPEPDEDTEMVALDVALDASESDDVPDIVNDPACGGRRIGEVWEVNGQSFKVGLDGRRLRHALVKQQRTKFPMPKDSAHNDARTHVDVVIEKWLNDEEYNQAKERFELAWQDSSPATTPVKAESTLNDDRVGKRLLWKGPATSPVKGRASMGPSSNGRNPFELAPSNSGRRVTSAHVFLNVPGESPKLRTSNSFSKWEKQDMEANSLKRMRARLEKEKKEKEQQKDQEKQNREAEKAKFSLPSVPTSAPLAPTTNKPTVETKSTPVPAATTPIQATKTTTVAPAPSGTPASSTPAGSIPNFFAKPSTTPATAAAPGATTQPSTTTSSLTTTPQNTFTGTTAPTAAKPSFSFGPLTTTTASGTSAPSEASQGNTPAKPTFSFGSPAPSMPSATPSAPAASTPTSGAAKPTFSFGTPSGQTTTSATTSDVSKAPPAFSFATPPANATMPSEQGKSAIPANPFAAKPATQPNSTPSFPPAGNLSSPFSINQSSQSQQQTTQNKPTFQFGTPSTPNNAENTSGTTQSKTGASSSSSLLNRLGPAPVLSQQPSQQNTTIPTQNAWSSPFGGTTTPSTSVFGQSQSQSQPQQGPSNASPNKSSPFAHSQPGKSVFGQPSMMGSQSAFSFGKASAGAPDPSKPAVIPSPFALAPQSGSPSIFGQPHSQSSASASQPSTSVFGQPSGQSGTVASQPVVPVFGQPSGQSSAFGSQQPASSVFGKASGETSASQKAGSLVFGKASGETSASQQAGSSVFGKAPGETSQKAGSSVFGKASGETLASQQAGSSVFGKPGGQSDASASQPKAPFSFNFGASSNSSSTSTTNTNPFQAAPTPATTVQANPAATNNSYAFGQPSANTSNTMPTTSAFGFNKPAEEEKK